MVRTIVKILIFMLPALAFGQQEMTDRELVKKLAPVIREFSEDKVFYPGLTTHPQHELACRQMSGFGGMISFEVGSKEAAERVMNRFRVNCVVRS